MPHPQPERKRNVPNKPAHAERCVGIFHGWISPPSITIKKS